MSLVPLYVNTVTTTSRTHALSLSFFKQGPFNAVKNQITVADQIYGNVSTVLNCNPSQGIKEVHTKSSYLITKIPSYHFSPSITTAFLTVCVIKDSKSIVIFNYVLD